MMVIVWVVISNKKKRILVKCIDIFVNIAFVLFLLLNCFLFIIQDANKLNLHF